MSASRRLRRSAQRHRARQLLSEVAHGTAEYLHPLDAHHDAFRLGDTLFVLPRVRDEMPEPMKNALTIRNLASITGVCSCGAKRHVRGSNPIRLTFTHTDACPASDESIRELLEAS